MKLSRRKIQFLNEDEDLRKKTVQTKNSLEELIYKINDYNSDELYLLVSNETQREEINLLAEEVLNFIFTNYNNIIFLILLCLKILVKIIERKYWKNPYLFENLIIFNLSIKFLLIY